jgi:nitrogen fixation protein FixH
LRSRISSLFVFLILALIVAGCGGGGGQPDQPEQQGSNGGDAAEKTAGGDKEKTDKAAKKKNVVRGTVEEIDIEGNTLTVKRPNGETESFRFNPERVKVSADGKEAAVEDIQAGQRVAVRFRGEGEKMVARSIITKSGAQGGGTTG